MAHISQSIGAHSELRAQAALLANGYEIAKPIVPEVYDLVARCPYSGRWLTFQVKTARIREDRGGAIVVDAKRANGRVYSRLEADYIIGVVGEDVYLIENRELGEYWVTPENINRRWRRLDPEFYRGEAAV